MQIFDSAVSAPVELEAVLQVCSWRSVSVDRIRGDQEFAAMLNVRSSLADYDDSAAIGFNDTAIVGLWLA